MLQGNIYTQLRLEEQMMIHTQVERGIKQGIITCLPNISTTAICRQAPARL